MSKKNCLWIELLSMSCMVFIFKTVYCEGSFVRIWDTGKTYTQKQPMDIAMADRANWSQVPYGKTDYEAKGDLLIENDFFYLFCFTNKEDAIDLMAKTGDTYKINEIYKVNDIGMRCFGQGTAWVKIKKYTAEEVFIEHAGESKRRGTPEEVVTTYRILAGKPWLEIKPVSFVNQQGMHGKTRICAFVKEQGEDFILDSKRETFTKEKDYQAPEGSMGIINFTRKFRKGYDFMWFLTFPPEAEKNQLTYLGFHADPFYEDEKKDRPSVGAQYAYMGEGGVVIGVLNNENNWKREDIAREVQKGEIYTTAFTTPYKGEWKMVARIADRYVHSRVKIDKEEQPFTFTSPEDGMLDYIMVYLWDRTEKSEKSLWTLMDVYRETIKKK